MTTASPNRTPGGSGLFWLSNAASCCITTEWPFVQFGRTADFGFPVAFYGNTQHPATTKHSGSHGHTPKGAKRRRSAPLFPRNSPPMAAAR